MSKEKSKLSSQPPKPRDLDQFLNSASSTKSIVEENKPGLHEGESSDSGSNKEQNLPWSGVRDDVIKSINLRLSEEYILKIQYLSNITNKSQQKILKEAIMPFIDAEIQKHIQ